MGTAFAVIEIAVAASAEQISVARRALRERLDHELDRAHVEALESVAGELLGAAVEGEVKKPLVLSVAVFARLTSVRVHCPSDVEMGDEPLRMRERMLQGLALAWGKRRYGDGSVDLWAEVPRSMGGEGAYGDLPDPAAARTDAKQP